MLVTVITWVCLVMSTLAFVVFAVLALRAKPPNVETRGGRADLPVSDIAKVADALAKLTESFTKAGPAISALVASILYLLIATLAAGINALPQR